MSGGQTLGANVKIVACSIFLARYEVYGAPSLRRSLGQRASCPLEEAVGYSISTGGTPVVPVTCRRRMPKVALMSGVEKPPAPTAGKGTGTTVRRRCARLLRGRRWCCSPIGIRQRFVGDDFFEESLYRGDKNPVNYRLLPSSVENERATFGVVLLECLETCEVFGSDSRGVLHFDGDKVRWRIDDEIHLQPGARTPEVERVAFAGIVEPCAEMLVDKPFESHPIDFLWPVQWPFGTECAVNSGIEEVELAVCYRLALRSLREYGEASRDEHFLKNLEIGINRGAFHFGFAGDGACGED